MKIKILIGLLVMGLATPAKPDLAQQQTEESSEKILEAVSNLSDMVAESNRLQQEQLAHLKFLHSQFVSQTNWILSSNVVSVTCRTNQRGFLICKSNFMVFTNGYEVTFLPRTKFITNFPSVKLED